ncbi:MAG TPA: YitT family protein [Acholeplasma sp.]|jgi:uncharacterized membrane-anchored protein YitT (DUF2179 family)|nr:YitT family protein [Acholeplasma sp.]
MNKIAEFFKSEKFKSVYQPEIKRLVAVVIFTIIYGFGVTWFLEGAAISLYTGGIPGIAQVTRDLFVYKLRIMDEQSSSTYMSIFIIIVNIPILLVGWFGVSHRFTIYSIISVIIQATIIGWMPKINLGLNTEEHVLAATILGGLLIGVGTGGALKYGTSTGGLDILAQYFAFKGGKSVGFFSMLMNVSIAVGGGIIMNGQTVNGVTIMGGLVVSYTALRIIISTIMTDKLHTSYQHLSVEIITDSPKVLVDEILHKVYRGVTLSKVEGAFSHHEKTLVMVVISSYELETLLHMVQNLDPKAFVVAKPVKLVAGNFKRKRIA